MKLTVITFILSSLISPRVHAEIIEGKAKSLDGTFEYIEIHNIERTQSGQTRKIETTYLTLEKSKIAQLVSDFSENIYIPDSTFEDFRSKTKFEGKLKENSTYEITSTERNGNKRIKKIPTDKNMIMGQGFDNFIRWGLVEKKISNAIVNFLVLFRKDFFEFEIKRESSESSELQHFKIKPVNFLIRVFAKEIDLFYTKNDFILQKYVGLSNIANDEDEHPMVSIVYKRIDSSGSKTKEDK